MAKLPILMYHDVSLDRSEGLTISVATLEAQFAYLASKNYTTYHCKELLELKTLAAKRNVIITFDDGFVTQLEYAVPLLKKYGLKATFFIPLKYLGVNDMWHTATKDIMTAEMLHNLDPAVIELAHHSYAHKKYHKLSEAETAVDIAKSFEVIDKEKLLLTSVIAYPYGKYPRETPAKKVFEGQLKKQNIQLGMRIGNRVNRFPFKKPFEIERIDVKGEFSLSTFKRRLRWGKLF